MKIRNIYIHRAGYVRHKLKINCTTTDLAFWNRLFGIYESRILGVCIYRDMSTQKQEQVKIVTEGACEKKQSVIIRPKNKLLI